eukprot:1156692-Pelagomonas_calceolata.AAC.4
MHKVCNICCHACRAPTHVQGAGLGQGDLGPQTCPMTPCLCCTYLPHSSMPRDGTLTAAVPAMEVQSGESKAQGPWVVQVGGCASGCRGYRRVRKVECCRQVDVQAVCTGNQRLRGYGWVRKRGVGSIEGSGIVGGPGRWVCKHRVHTEDSNASARERSEYRHMCTFSCSALSLLLRALN